MRADSWPEGREDGRAVRSYKCAEEGEVGLVDSNPTFGWHLKSWEEAWRAGSILAEWQLHLFLRGQRMQPVGRQKSAVGERRKRCLTRILLRRVTRGPGGRVQAQGSGQRGRHPAGLADCGGSRDEQSSVPTLQIPPCVLPLLDRWMGSPAHKS